MTTAKVATATEIQQASMINVMGYDINIYGTILLIFLGVFLFALWRAQKAQRLDWLDMLTRDGTKISATKVLQLVGGVVGTWIIIKVTLQGTLTWDLFGIYLTYVASIDGFSKFMMARYGAEGSDDSRVPYRRRDNFGGRYPEDRYGERSPRYGNDYPEELGEGRSGHLDEPIKPSARRKSARQDAESGRTGAAKAG